MRKFLTIALSICFSVYCIAEEVTFKSQAPNQVIVGRPFQLTFSVNHRGKDLRAPEFTNFEVLAGPYTSTSSSTSFVNGHRTSTFNQTYTYTLIAQHPGTFTIGPANIKVDGETYQSNGVRIQVLPEDEQTTAENTTSSSSQRPQTQSGGDAQVSNNNLFVRTIVSKTRVHEQEAVLLTYKLYFANVDVAQLTNNTQLPEFTGFLKQELNIDNIQTELEHYNGRNYQTAVLYQTILYPQHAGDIKIGPATFEAVIRVQTRQQVRSIFDDFFASYTNVTKAITAPGTTIQVSSLPANKPATFSGGVGAFSITPTISQTEVLANEAITIRLDISGSGNMKLLKTPFIEWPDGFEPYDPKVTNNFSTTTAGVSGTKSIEYLAIPRNAGEYIIPPVEFSYFDIGSKQYRTLSTPEYTIRVKRNGNESVVGDEGNNASTTPVYTPQEEIKQLGSDIRYINTKPFVVSQGGKKFRLSSLGTKMAYIYLIPLLMAIVLLIILRKKIRENADIRKVRYKHANKVAQKRLRAAEKALKENNKEHFYAEIEKAAWTYLSDRLSIPTAELNKENITSILTQKGIETSLITAVKEVLSTAEFARYAPTSEHAMDDLYQNTTHLINQLEQQKL
jgi:hypothetical protein